MYDLTTTTFENDEIVPAKAKSVQGLTNNAWEVITQIYWCSCKQHSNTEVDFTDTASDHYIQTSASQTFYN